MLAVLQAGGVLVPIDPSHTEDHQRELAAAAGCRVAVVAAAGAGWLGLPTFVLGAGGELAGRAEAAPATRDPYGPDVAYVMFTSGSTGNPKGVVGSHRGLSHFLRWQRVSFQVAPSDVVLQLTRPAFDVVLRDVFLPLASGATLALPESHDALAPDEVFAALVRYGVTLLHTVPSLAEFWLTRREPQQPVPSILRTVFFAGEPLTGDFVQRWRALLGAEMDVVNLYGPTETTLAVCAYRVPTPAPAGVLPLGRPLPDIQVLPVDERNRPCPVGAPGELVIRSPYRSHGYLDPMATAFTPNLLWPRAEDDDLLYRTGDLGRRRPDGSLEFLGRGDDQVKIRGVRVDLIEVAGTAMRHPGVAACTVVVRVDAHDEQMLIGYVILEQDTATDHTSIRDFMRRQLPLSSVPSAFVTVTEFPRLPSGKVDRGALPAPVLRRGDRPGGYEAPQTDMERRLSELWAESLHLDRVGVTDDFFELGGHSLIAPGLVSRIREEMGASIPLRVLFDASTVREQAAWIAANREGPAPDEGEAMSRTALDEVEAAYRKLQELPDDVRSEIMGNW